MSSPVVACFLAVAKRCPEHIALVEGSRELSFSALLQEIRAYAAYLERRGIGKGDRVLVYVPMGISLYVILIALWYRGATAVFVDAWTSRNRIQTVAERMHCKAFIGIPKAHFLRLRSAALRAIPIKIWVLPFGTPKGAREGSEPVACDLDDTALVTFTTGSTGSPKGANRTHRFLLAQQGVLADHLALSPSAVDLTTLPIFVLSNLAQGITSVLGGVDPASPDSVDPTILEELTERHGITCTAGSPVIYQKWARYYLDRGTSGPDLENLFLGGAPVFPELATDLIAAFPNTRIEIVYGSTEAEPISSVLAEDLVSNDTSRGLGGLPVGKPVSQIDLVILGMTDDPLPTLTPEDLSKRTCADGCVGEICVRGKHVLNGYVGDVEAQASTKISVGEHVWHRTGDAGYLDESGDLFLLGRVQRRICCGDRWLFALPFEHALGRIEGFRSGTIVEADEQLYIVVELAQERAAGDLEAIAKIVDQLAPGVAYDVRFQPLPRDPRHNSKIDYGRLQAELVRVAA